MSEPAGTAASPQSRPDAMEGYPYDGTDPAPTQQHIERLRSWVMASSDPAVHDALDSLVEQLEAAGKREEVERIQGLTADDARKYIEQRDALVEQLEAQRQHLETAAVEAHRRGVEASELREQLEAVRETLGRIHQNATSWHGVIPGPEDGFHGHAGHADALAVIAKWCDEALGDSNPAKRPT